MSTQMPSSHPSATPANRREIRIVSHSNLFYWWPLWAVGFVLFFLTLIDGHNLAIVPRGTEPLREVKVIERSGTERDGVDVLVAPGKSLPPKHSDVPSQPRLHIAESASYGVMFIVVLLLLIVITNVPLRGLWSVVVIVVIVLLSIIFALADWWRPVLEALFSLHIYINAAGYLVIASALLVIWLVTLYLFDPQIYMVFTPGQLRVRQEIGGGEAAYDTMGMVIQKQRNDLFRHWILGLGSGDLIVNTSGASAHHFDLPNVLFVGYKVKQIEDMLREKTVVQG
jgi:hypothetical protein